MLGCAVWDGSRLTREWLPLSNEVLRQYAHKDVEKVRHAPACCVRRHCRTGNVEAQPCTVQGRASGRQKALCSK